MLQLGCHTVILYRHFIAIVLIYIINYIIVLVEAVFVAPRSEELGIAT